MACKTRMSILHPPITYIYAVFFIVGCIVAVLGNILALIIIIRFPSRSRSTKMLIPLTLSDLLVGIIVLPITIYQVLHYDNLDNCAYDYTRVYCSAFFQGASVLTLAIIAFDRYLLMTKMKTYQKARTKNVMLVLIIVAWLIPGLIPILRWVNKAAYLASISTIFIVPFITLLVCYSFITKALKEQQARLRKYKTESNQQSIISSENQNQIEQSSTSSEMQSKQSNILKDSNGEKLKRQLMTKSQINSKKSHIKVAKSVALLLIAYFFCTIPLITWLILDLINIKYQFMTSYAHQNLYLFAMVLIAYNSAINPLIYFWKNPDTRKGFRKFLGMHEGTVYPTSAANDAESTKIGNERS